MFLSHQKFPAPRPSSGISLELLRELVVNPISLTRWVRSESSGVLIETEALKSDGGTKLKVRARHDVDLAISKVQGAPLFAYPLRQNDSTGWFEIGGAPLGLTVFDNGRATVVVPEDESLSYSIYVPPVWATHHQQASVGQFELALPEAGITLDFRRIKEPADSRECAYEITRRGDLAGSFLIGSAVPGETTTELLVIGPDQTAGTQSLRLVVKPDSYVFLAPALTIGHRLGLSFGD